MLQSLRSLYFEVSLILTILVIQMFFGSERLTSFSRILEFRYWSGSMLSHELHQMADGVNATIKKNIDNRPFKE